MIIMMVMVYCHFICFHLKLFSSNCSFGKFPTSLSCSCYLFVGDWGFEVGGPLSPRRDDRREEEDESELEPDLEDCKLPDLEDCKPPDLEGSEAPGSVIVKPECFMTQNNRNTSSLSPCFKTSDFRFKFGVC